MSTVASEVQSIYTDYYNQLMRQNPGCTSSQITPYLPSKSKIATDLSAQKKNICRKQLYDCFSEALEDLLGKNNYQKLIDSFISSDTRPLANALVTKNKNVIEQQIFSEHFPKHNLRDIAKAIDDNGQNTATNIARLECLSQFKAIQKQTRQFESVFFNIRLGKGLQPLETEDHISWVPASVRHEVAKDENSGQTRYSFFVYGGVSLQSKPNYLYQKLDAQGNHLKFGITKNPDTRYTASQMNGCRLNLVAQGSRQEMLKLERAVHSTLPIGPEERQRGI